MSEIRTWTTRLLIEMYSAQVVAASSLRAGKVVEIYYHMTLLMKSILESDTIAVEVDHLQERSQSISVLD